MSFDCRYGRLVYPVDVCEFRQHNVRSVALGLEALRAVDRYRVSRTGQQYAGWKALTSGSGDPQSEAEAREVLINASGLDREGGISMPWRQLYRLAAKATHPDHGGAGHAFARVEAARRLLEGSAA